MVREIYKTVKKVWQILSIVLVCLTVALAILLVGSRVIGFTPYTVLSGSMEPFYHVGSLIYVKDIDANTLKVGDPITYRMGGNVVTHRINEVYEDEKTGGIYYQTKGDANNMPDGPILYPENVIGKPVFTIPLLGYVSNFVQNPPGTFIVIGACALYIFISTLFEMIFGEDNTKTQEDKPTN